MEDGALRVPPDAATAFGQSVGVRPLYRIDGAGVGALSAAKWKLDDCRVATDRLAQSILAFRTAGSAVVTRRTHGATVRRRPAIGSATFAPADAPACWTGEGSSEALHVYIPPLALQRFAERELEMDGVPVIRDFFAIVDPWLRGYFQMLASEADVAASAEKAHATDSLFLGETEHVLLRRLVRCHSDADPRNLASLETGRPAMPLQSSIMRRVQEYVDANLAHDIRLQDLAALGYMSSGHFLRRFRATCGTTPYQYVLEQRLQRARTMLVDSAYPIGDIAQECGFGTASHLSSRFHARFGVQPSSCRKASARGSGQSQAISDPVRRSDRRTMDPRAEA